MNIIKSIFGIFGPSKMSNQINTVKDERKAECPYCEKTLDKTPSRKKQCPNCGKFMYVRTHPRGDIRLVVTKQQADEIDEERAFMQETNNEYFENRERFEVERNILRQRFGTEPSDRDVMWCIYNKLLIEYSKNGNWGLYRNVRFNMADSLSNQMKLQQALETYFEVCYLDLNGTSNSRGWIGDNPELLRQFPIFDPTTGFLAPAIIDRIRRILQKLELKNDETRKIYIDHNIQIEKSFKMPLSAEVCWDKTIARLIYPGIQE